MTKLKNTLDILNSEQGSKLFHEWNYEWSEEFTEDGEDHLLIKAKFFFDGAEIDICEWLWSLAPYEPFVIKAHKETYHMDKGAEDLAIEMDIRGYSITELIYKAFISEFNIAYNLAEGE